MTTSAPSTPRQHWYMDYAKLSPDTAAMVRARRIQVGLSVRETARMAGISGGYLSRLERGLRAPRVDAAERLAMVLRLGPGERGRLLGEAVDG